MLIDFQYLRAHSAKNCNKKSLANAKGNARQLCIKTDLSNWQ